MNLSVNLLLIRQLFLYLPEILITIPRYFLDFIRRILHSRSSNLLLILLFNAIIHPARAEISLKPGHESIVIGRHVAYLRDDAKVLTIDSVTSPAYQSKFIQGNKDVFTHPLTRGAFWFRISVSNHSGQDAWLEVGSIAARYIDLYCPGGNDKPILTGTQRGEVSKPYAGTMFWLPLNKAEEKGEKTYYLRIEEETPFEVPLTIGTLQSLHAGKTLMDYLTAGFIGAILIMLLYNAFLWLSTRETLYLVYVLYLATCLVIPPAHNGYLVISSLVPQEWIYNHVVFFMSIANIIIGVFAILYLGLKKELPRLYRFIVVVIASLGVMGFLNFLYPYGFLFNTFQVFILLLYLACLGSAWYLLFKKRRQAFFYTMGWTFMLVFTGIVILTINGYLPYNVFTRNSSLFGITLEAWLFSLALGNRINVLKKQQEAAQIELLEKVTENERLVRTQNQQLEFEVGRRTSELKQQAQHLHELIDSRNRFFSILAHDLKNPFNTIIGFAEVLSRNIDNYSREKIKLNVEYILTSSRHAYNLLDQLLDWGRMQTGDMEFRPSRFNFRHLLIETLAASEAQAQQKGIQVNHTIDKDFEVFGDRCMIGIVLRNLLTNSLKFTRSGGEVSIGSAKEGPFFSITVSDTGVGIPEENLKKLFRTDIKFSTKGTANENGTGLGLILCREFINKNGGSIRVSSAEGSGSQFIFTVPSGEN